MYDWSVFVVLPPLPALDPTIEVKALSQIPKGVGPCLSVLKSEADLKPSRAIML